MKKIVSVFLPFSPFLIYLTITQMVGELHPFSKFPMYSSFPESADYFYIADENNTPLSTYKLTGVTIDQLKDMVEVRAKNYLVERKDIPGMKIIAAECLEDIKTRLPKNTGGLKEIKWVRHEIYKENNGIVEKKTILAKCNLN